MRNRFDEQLELLNKELIHMGVLCNEVISNATIALIEGDMKAAKYVIAKDEDIDHQEREIETLCLKLLLQQQPVAKDLRQISAALKMITDMERIGDQAADIAEITLVAKLKLPEAEVRIQQMGAATIKMVEESVEAYVKKDLDLARQVIDYDDVVDQLFDEVKDELIELIVAQPKQGIYAMDLLMIAKYFERIGDHATNIAEWVEFSITGEHRGEEEVRDIK